MNIESRKTLYEQVAKGMSARYEQIRSTGVDTGVSGSAGEKVLINWITSWLPKRMSVVQGAVLSIGEDPTNQMDCLLFDSSESPVYSRLGDSDLVPIEGVSGSIEVNSGNTTTYEKLLKDALKLTKLRQLARNKMPRASIPISHISREIDPNNVTEKQLVEGLQGHRSLEQHPLTVIFAENINGNLEEAATRIARHNIHQGVEFSVDGLFIMGQGVALHVDQNRLGWTSQRLTGNEFAYLTTSPGQVLLKLQSIILNHLYLSGKTNPKSFDPYLSELGLGAREITEAKSIVENEYVTQTGREYQSRG